MAVITAPTMGAQARWMRHALLVAALAGAGEAGAQAEVPGASLWQEGPMLVLEVP